MHFYYDAQSRPAMVNFNGAYYMYLHNLQGDIARKSILSKHPKNHI